MKDREQAKNAIVSEAETICFVLDEILDNLDRVNVSNAVNISERLALSRIQASRALNLLNEGDEEQ